MNADDIYQEVQKQADNILAHLKKSTKNIIWTMEIETEYWDCRIMIKGSYLIYHSLIYSPSLELDRAINDNKYISKKLEYFGDYALHTTIQNISRAMFEAK